ncbi:hypothetical protein VPHF99_0012 [Vibrio phage F99]
MLTVQGFTICPTFIFKSLISFRINSTVIPILYYVNNKFSYY